MQKGNLRSIDMDINIDIIYIYIYCSCSPYVNNSLIKELVHKP